MAASQLEGEQLHIVGAGELSPARLAAVCWGVTPVVQPEATSAEQVLAFAIEWARSHRIVRPGQHVVLLRGQVPGHDRSRPVLAREVS